MAGTEPNRTQLELLALWGDGLSYAEIAAQAHMSIAGVRYHLDRLRVSLDAPHLGNALIKCVVDGHLCIDGRARQVFVPSAELVAA